MSKVINFVLAGLVLMGAFWLYQVKQEAKETEETIAKLEQKISDEKDALLLLKAEWSSLNRPERVEELLEQHKQALGLQEAEPYQVGLANDLPDRPNVNTRDVNDDGGLSQETIDDVARRASASSILSRTPSQAVQ